MKIIFMALALTCILEALPWLINPQKTKDTLMELMDLPNDMLRNVALGLFSVGVIVFWLVLQFII